MHIIGDDQLTKNWIDFMKIKLHSNENIEWCLNWI
jgi:hypothetical protein